MLLRFRVADHRSIRDECELSLVGTKDYDDGVTRVSGLRQGDDDVSVEPVVASSAPTPPGSPIC